MAVETPFPLVVVPMVKNRLPARYRVIEEVGQGGMAVVYRAEDQMLKREVAVKVLHPHLLSEVESKARLGREAQAVAKLQHDNILHIFDYSGPDSESAYLVTEFIDGVTLKQFLSNRKLPVPELGALIALQVALALRYAHGAGIIHRDVKPENVMVRKDGVVKLMDFGVAQIVDLERMTVTGQLLGSPAYMAPELLEGKPIDFRTDVFALGIMLYQLTTGQLPFSGRNPHEVLRRIAEGRFSDPRAINHLVADRLARIIVKALARKPDDRYASMSLMGEDLAAFLRDAGFVDTPTELKAFFTEPERFDQEVQGRMVAALATAGRIQRTAGHTARALELWNRALALDPRNADVLRDVRRLEGGQRLRRGSVAVLSAGLLGAAVFLAFRIGTHDAPTATPRIVVKLTERTLPPTSPQAAPVAQTSAASLEKRPSTAAPRTSPRSGPHAEKTAATSAQPVATRTFTLTPIPPAVDIIVDGQPKGAFDLTNTTVTIPWVGSHKIELRPKSRSFFPGTVLVGPDEEAIPDNRIIKVLAKKPATLVIAVNPPTPGARIALRAQRGSKPWSALIEAGKEASVPFDADDEITKTVQIFVSLGNKPIASEVKVTAGESTIHQITLGN